MKNKLLTIIFSLFILIIISTDSYAREDISLEDGYYKVGISLWHSMEDKESMGNRALSQSADLKIKDSQMELYIESEKIKIQDIESSMLNFYSEDQDENYKKAEEACYDIQIKNEIKKRPRLFRINLYNIKDFTNVLMDPKVEIMGKDPIKARLKIKWDTLEKINEEDALLAVDFNNDLRERNIKDSFKQDNGVFLHYNEDLFNEDFDFSVKELSENEKYDLKDYGFSNFAGYQLRLTKAVNIIPKDIQGSIDYLREEIKPEDNLNIGIPIKDCKKINLYKLANGEKIKLDYEIKDGFINFKERDLGTYIVEESETSVLDSKEIKKSPLSMSVSAKKNTNPIKNSVNPKNTLDNAQRSLNSDNSEVTDKSSPNMQSIATDNSDSNRKTEENKYIIVFLIFTAILIMYFTVYTVKKYSHKLTEEVSIYLELKKRMREYEQ